MRPQRAWIWVLLGLGLWADVIGSTVAAFDQAHAIPYSWKNHVISELGFPFASTRTWIFDGGLALGAWLLWPAVAAVRGRYETKRARVAGFLGVVMCAGNSMIGFWGLTWDLHPGPFRLWPFLLVHVGFAVAAALAWEAMVILFAIEAWSAARNGLDRAIAWLSTTAALVGPAVVTWNARPGPLERGLLRDLRNPSFVEALRVPGETRLSDWLDVHRPPHWHQAMGEWALVSTLIAWHVAAAIILSRSAPRPRTVPAAA